MSRPEPTSTSRQRRRTATAARWAVLPLLVVLLAGLGGCEINKPEMPTFDTAMTVPLGVDRIDIMELVEDEDYLVAGQDGTLSFTVDGDPDTMTFDFDLSADIGGQTVQQGLGNFALADPAPLAYGFLLSDIWAPAAGMSGFLTVVPAFPIDVNSSGQDIPDIQSATLASGSMTVGVDNGLPVPISADSGPDQLILVLEDPSDSSPVATFVFDEIAAGGHAERTVDLAGVTLPDQVQVHLTGGSAGSSGSLVTVNGDDSIDVEAAFNDLVVSEATAVVDVQRFTTSFDTELPADYALTRAVISSGAIQLDLRNDMPVPCTAWLTWPNLLDLDEQPLTVELDLAAGQTANRTVDFSGYVLSADDPLTVLTAQLEIYTPGSSGQPVSLSAGDGLTAELHGGTIAFESVTGLIPDYELALDTFEEEIDLPDEMDGIELTAATMVLHLTNASGVPGEVDLTLTGVSAAGQTTTLDVLDNIAPAIGRSPQTTTITLDQTNSGIVDFLNNLPERITLDGSVLVGGGAEGTVRADDWAIVSWEILAPVEVIINGSTIDSDPESLDLDEDLQDIITDHALGAVVQTEILNHMPVGVELRILASTDTLTIDTAPELVIGPLAVAAAEVDPVSHTVSQAIVSYPEITLSAEEARIIGRPGLHTKLQVTLPSTEGNPVRMLSTDYIEVRGIAKLDVNVSDEW